MKLSNVIIFLVTILVSLRDASGQEVNFTPRQLEFDQAMLRLILSADHGAEGICDDLIRLGRGLAVSDPNHYYPVFLWALGDLNPELAGTFEDDLVSRYESLMQRVGEWDAEMESELEAIAVYGKRVMSVRLGRLFLRDAQNVAPYKFGKIEPRGGWRSRDKDDWRGLQGRMISASVACNDLAVTKEWLQQAESAKGDLRKLIIWALGYSMREEVIDYLMKKYQTEGSDEMRLLIKYALGYSNLRMERYAEQLKKGAGAKFGVLSAVEAEELRFRLEALGPKVKERLSKAGILVESPMDLYWAD
jgi:hypothetical protein